jgi:aminopeptidase N
MQHLKGDEAFHVVLRQMRRWGMEDSAHGPLSLGYRLGHIRDDGRVFRAVVYNKGGAVLHMLRRLVGDDAFFLGLRRFYANWRFEKAGTEDFRRAMESETGRSLEQFFERWVYDSALPQLKFSYRLDAGRGEQDRAVVLRVDQTGPIFDVPVTVLLHYAEGLSAEVIVPASDRTTELRVPLSGTLRRVEVREDATLAEIQK